MKVLFDLTTTIEIPDTDKFPSIEGVTEMLVELFKKEGMIAHELEVTYWVVASR